MAAIVFDVREAERRLLDAGASPEVAEATADLMSEAVVHNLDALVTRDYLDHALDARFSQQDARIDRLFQQQDAKFDQIDVPELGTSVFLIPGERVKNREEMLLTLDVVVNHASNQHEWTQRARRGEQTYIDYFYIFDNRDIPDLFEETMVGSRCGESWRCPYGYTT